VARATTADVLKRWGGTYPPGADATNTADWCEQADEILNAYTHPDTLSTTDSKVKAVAVDVVERLYIRMVWMQAGGPMSGQPEPEVLTQDIKEKIDRLSIDSTYDGFTTAKMWESST